jgi:hypothetical protein
MAAVRADVSFNILHILQSKGKGHPITGHKGPIGGVEVQLYSFSTSALKGGGSFRVKVR